MLGAARRHNQPLTYDQGIQVILRSRPTLNKALKSSIQIKANQCTLDNPRNPNEQLTFSFDQCFGSKSPNDEIFNQILIPLLENLLNGFNVTVFAYGMTGAGKTFTMNGSPNQLGIIPLAIQHLLSFTSLSTNSNLLFGSLSNLSSSISTSSTSSSSSSNPSLKNRIKIEISALEIYKERIYDLLLPNCNNREDLQIREDQNKNIFIPNLSIISLDSFEQFQRIFQEIIKTRSTNATILNSHSSRSHACITIYISHFQGNHESSPTKCTKMHLVDLAGSEDNRKTTNNSERMAESGAINKSLFVLGQVVEALNNPLNRRIPYRDSKLTRLLQDSLGQGKSIGLLIANIAPEADFIMETLNTLTFASRTKSIIIKPVLQVMANQPSSNSTNSNKKRKKEGKNSLLKDASFPRSQSSLSSPSSRDNLPNDDLYELSESPSFDETPFKGNGKGKRIKKEKGKKNGKGKIKENAEYENENENEIANLNNEIESENLNFNVKKKREKRKNGKESDENSNSIKRKRRESNINEKLVAFNNLLSIFPNLEENLLCIINWGNLSHLRQLKELGDKRSRVLKEFIANRGPISKIEELFTERGGKEIELNRENENGNSINCLWSRNVVWKIVSENAQNITKLQELAQRVLEDVEVE